MMDPTPLMFAANCSRELSRSATPHAPQIAEKAAADPARGPHPLATMLRRLADGLDGRRGARVHVARGR